MTTQRYFIELSYNGANYHGWQIQKNAVSVQEVLNDRLSIILRQPIETTGCGRTDTGVHAKQFFAHFDIQSMDHEPWTMDKTDAEESMDHGPWTMDKTDAEESMDHGPWTMDKTDAEESMDHGPRTMGKNIVRSLNAILPDDIAVKDIYPVAADAHARFDAKLRTYEYHIHFNKDPFKKGFSWELKDRPNIDLMNQAAKILMEHTDFSCFSKSNTQVKTNNCKITAAEWSETGTGIVFHISADRFLRNMVRAIVGTLMMVGKKEIEPNDVRQIIESKNRSNAGTSVPACGLYLTEIKY